MKMLVDYPLKFEPIFKDKIWGGQKLSTSLGKDLNGMRNCGESWEISGVPGDVSIVSNGPLAGQSLTDLMTAAKVQLLGHRLAAAHPTEFPLLIKFLDANDDLSIQVHPNDVQAKRRHGCLGKTEMWYILEAEPGAKLIAGFNKNTSKEEYQERLQNRRLKAILNEEMVAPGDVYYIPAGRIHTIGKGILLAEIQQSSDVTYRIYDFDRIDSQGNKRDLHVEEAMDVIDFEKHEHYKTPYENAMNEVIPLVRSPHFQTHKMQLTSPMKRDLKAIDSFIIYICIEGQGTIRAGAGDTPICKGECLLVPAAVADISLEPVLGFTLLETFIPLP
jgi:mannose-6-phosphate isomerase